MATEDEELFNSVFSSNPPADEGQGEGGDADAQAREEAERAAQAAAQEADAGDNGDGEGDEGHGQDGDKPRTRRGRVPVDELLEERGKRHSAETKAEMTERQNAELRRELEELRRGQQQPRKAEDDDENEFWNDPDKALAKREASLRREFEQREISRDLRAAHRQHGEEFEKAYDFVTSRMPSDPALRVRLMQADDHGEAIMSEYRREMTLQEVGDPAKYRETLRGDLLKDPEFLKEAVEALKVMAAGGQPGAENGGRPSNSVQLPPSLSKAPGSPGKESLPRSDAELFAQTFGELRS